MKEWTISRHPYLFPINKWRGGSKEKRYICFSLWDHKAKFFETREDALWYLTYYSDKYDFKGWRPVKTATLIDNCKNNKFWKLREHNFRKIIIANIRECSK